MSEQQLRLATVKEACGYAKMSQSRLYLHLKDGSIRAYKRDDQTLVDLDSVDAFNKAKLEPWVPAHKRRR